MKVPYLKNNELVSSERVNYIKNTCGGSTGIYSGALFWLMGSIVSLFSSQYVSTSFYIFGGAILVPILSVQLLKLKKKDKVDGEYLSLTIISNMAFIVAYPIVFVIQQQIPNYVPVIIALINAVHLLVFMWIHMEFLYCILTVIYSIVSMLFILYAPNLIFNYLGFVLCFINIIFAILIEKNAVNFGEIYKERSI